MLIVLENPASTSHYNRASNNPVFSFGYYNFYNNREGETDSPYGSVLVQCLTERCNDAGSEGWTVGWIDDAFGPVNIQSTYFFGNTYALTTSQYSSGYYDNLHDLNLYDCNMNDVTPTCTIVNSDPLYSDVYPNYQFIIDEYNQFHFVGLSRANDTVNLLYTFCTSGSLDNCESITLDTFQMRDNELTVKMSQQSGDLGYPMIKVLYEDSATSNDNGRIVIVLLSENDHESQSETKSNSVFKIYECLEGSREHAFNCDNFYNIPRVNDELRIRGIVDWFDVVLQPSSADGNLFIAYGYRSGVLNQPGGNLLKRATPDEGDAGDMSREPWSVRSIRCLNAQCSRFDTRQVVGGNLLWNSFSSAVVRGVKVVYDNDVNNGNPVVVFGVGQNMDSSKYTSSSFINNFYGGKIGIISCNDESCSTASFLAASDRLAGHAGDFTVIANKDTFLISSPQRRGANKSPIFQHFTNNIPAPQEESCNAENGGRFLVVDEVVYTCSRLDKGHAFDATELWYWSPVVPEIRAMHTGNPFTVWYANRRTPIVPGSCQEAYVLN